MAKPARTLTLLALVALSTAGVVATADSAAANEGYPVCVTAGTPVETGPGATVTYTMNAHQAWHVYTNEANQWTQGYVSGTNPVQRGWVWAGHFTSQQAVPAPAGGDYCP